MLFTCFHENTIVCTITHTISQIYLTLLLINLFIKVSVSVLVSDLYGLGLGLDRLVSVSVSTVWSRSRTFRSRSRSWPRTIRSRPLQETSVLPCSPTYAWNNKSVSIWAQLVFVRFKLLGGKMTSFSKTTLLQRGSFLTMFYNINSSPVLFTK